MKIAVISNQAYSLINFRGPLLAEMRRRGYEVLAFAPDFDSETRNSLSALGVQAVDYSISRSGTNPLKEIHVIFELRRLFLKHKPDVCFAYFVKPVIYSMISAWLAGVPRRYGLIEGLGFAFTDLSVRSLRRRVTKIFISILARISLIHANRIIFLNKEDQYEFIKSNFISENRSSLLGGIGVDLKFWQMIPPPLKEITFILVARLLCDKGIREYVAAARIIRATYPQVKFVLLGGLDDNPASIPRREVEAWVAEGVIEWPGHVQVKPWLEKASVFVLPSYYREGIPRSTQEAMAIGRPIVTTDVPGCRETVINGRNGFLVSPRDIGELVNAMQYFIINPDKIVVMGAEGRKLAEDLFDSDIQNRKLLEFINL